MSYFSRDSNHSIRQESNSCSNDVHVVILRKKTQQIRKKIISEVYRVMFAESIKRHHQSLLLGSVLTVASLLLKNITLGSICGYFDLVSISVTS